MDDGTAQGNAVEREDTVRTATERGERATNIRWWRYGLLVGAMWLVPLHAAAQTWVPTDINNLGGATTSQAIAVSDNGTVAGTYTTAGGATHGFVWSGGSGWNDPGTLGGTTTVPRAVNRAGQVAGYSYTGTA